MVGSLFSLDLVKYIEVEMKYSNPFSVVKAADFTDNQINELWIDYGANTIESILELRNPISKFILGGKGTGKTHLLRYHTYLVAKNRKDFKDKDSLYIIDKLGAITAFYRANHMSYSKFNLLPTDTKDIFISYYTELLLCEGILQTLCEIKRDFDAEYNDEAFIKFLEDNASANLFDEIYDIEGLLIWFQKQRRKLGIEINNFALTQIMPSGSIYFTLGSLLMNLQGALEFWNDNFAKYPITLFIDEFENFSIENQRIFNTLVRMSEGKICFRIASRLKGIKGQENLNSDEVNLAGHEYSTIVLDNILNESKTRQTFLSNCIKSRINSTFLDNESKRFELKNFLESLDTDRFMEGSLKQLNLPYGKIEESFKKQFMRSFPNEYADDVFSILTEDIPYLLIKKHNILRFYKTKKTKENFLEIAKDIRLDSIQYIKEDYSTIRTYKNSFSHYKLNLFAQICKDSRKSFGVPYAGYEILISMCSGNPRNILSLFRNMYDIVSFNGEDFFKINSIDILVQSESAMKTSKYLLNEDSSYGSTSEYAKKATDNLARYLQAARFAQNIPESSPLAFSFDLNDLTQRSREVYNYCIRFSFIVELEVGRLDRNSTKRIIKAKLNPMISPNWSLPVSVRGDMSIGTELINLIFDDKNDNKFEIALNDIRKKWDNPLQNINKDIQLESQLPTQGDLF